MSASNPPGATGERARAPWQRTESAEDARTVRKSLDERDPEPEFCANAAGGPDAAPRQMIRFASPTPTQNPVQEPAAEVDSRAAAKRLARAAEAHAPRRRVRPRRWIGLPPALACLAFAAGARADEPPAPGPAPAAAPTGAASGEAEQTPSSGAGLGSANRLVVEIAAVGGYTFGNLTRADLRSIDGTGYLFSSNTGGQFLATCGSTDALPGSGECRALSDPGSSGTVGAELLMGWAVDEGVIFGGRFLAGANLPGGLLIAAGPAASVRVGPVWIGGGVALGTLHYRANLTGALGSVPAEFQDASGASEIEIPFEHLPVKRDTLHTKFILGVTLEVTGAVYDVEAGSDDVGRGSLVIGGWPTVVYTFPGVGLSIPVGIGYRFY